MTSVWSVDRPLAFSTGLLLIGVGFGIIANGPGNPVPSRAIDSQSAIFFFLRNVSVAGILYVGGITFGLLSTVTLLFNGFVIGFSINQARIWYSLTLIAPHGIIELPAFILAGAAGLQFPVEVIAYFLGNQEALVSRGALRHSGVRFGLAVLMLAVAAIIEATITPLLL